MRKLIANTFVTLDGVMQAPGAPKEDPSNGFTHGGWIVNYWSPDMMAVMMEASTKMGGLLLGRGTYEIFAAHWPRVSDSDPMAALLNRVPKYVASRTLKRVDWNNSTLLGPDLEGEIRQIKQQSGAEIQIFGSWGLLQWLNQRDLVDEYRVWTFPVVLGTGKRLFDDGAAPSGLELLDSRKFESGVVASRYRPAGAPKYGSFALED